MSSRDPGGRLARIIRRDRPDVTVTDHKSVPWASVTFNGARHVLCLRALDTPGLEQWVDNLAEVEFDLPGHLVADLAITAIERTQGEVFVRLEALTVET